MITTTRTRTVTLDADRPGAFWTSKMMLVMTTIINWDMQVITLRTVNNHAAKTHTFELWGYKGALSSVSLHPSFFISSCSCFFVSYSTVNNTTTIYSQIPLCKPVPPITRALHLHPLVQEPSAPQRLVQLALLQSAPTVPFNPLPLPQDADICKSHSSSLSSRTSLRERKRRSQLGQVLVP